MFLFVDILLFYYPMKNTYACLVILSALVLTQCRLRNSAQIANEKIKLSLHPADGVKYHTTVSSTTQSVMTFKDKVIDNTNTTEIGLTNTVSRDSAGNYTISIVYDQVKVKMDKNGQEQFFDAREGKNSGDPVEQSLYHLLGVTLQARLDQNGKLLAVDGTDKIVSGVLATLPDIDPLMRKKLTDQMEKLAGSQFLAELLGETAQLFPKTEVGIDDEWTTTSTQQLNGTLTADATCTLAAMTDSTAKIELVAKMHNSPDKNQAISLSAVQMDLTGEQSGYLVVARSSGIIVSSSMKADLEGVAHTAQGDIPVTITTQKEVTSERL